jgi:hypothetical protein
MVLGYSLSYAIIVTPPDTNGILPQINENPEAALASIIQFFILITAILAVMAITW